MDMFRWNPQHCWARMLKVEMEILNADSVEKGVTQEISASNSLGFPVGIPDQRKTHREEWDHPDKDHNPLLVRPRNQVLKQQNKLRWQTQMCLDLLHIRLISCSNFCYPNLRHKALAHWVIQKILMKRLIIVLQVWHTLQVLLLAYMLNMSQCIG